MNDAIIQVITDYTPYINELKENIHSIDSLMKEYKTSIDVFKDFTRTNQIKISKEMSDKIVELEKYITEISCKNKILIEENVNFNLDLIEKKLQIISSNFESLFKTTKKDFDSKIECVMDSIRNVPASDDIKIPIVSITKEDISNLELNFKNFYDSTVKVNTIIADNYNTLFLEVYKHEGNLKQIENDIDIIFDKQADFNNSTNNTLLEYSKRFISIEKDFLLIKNVKPLLEENLNKQIELLSQKINNKKENIKNIEKTVDNFNTSIKSELADVKSFLIKNKRETSILEDTIIKQNKIIEKLTLRIEKLESNKQEKVHTRNKSKPKEAVKKIDFVEENKPSKKEKMTVFGNIKKLFVTKGK